MSKIKLYFLTGFLGAGKTTILRNLLENMEGTKVGVIQNELGKISIDGTVLQNNDIQMIELNRGSIFCSCLRLSFVDALTQMAQKGLEYVFVESSGFGDPSNAEEILAATEVMAPGHMTSEDASAWWTVIIFWIRSGIQRQLTVNLNTAILRF